MCPGHWSQWGLMIKRFIIILLLLNCKELVVTTGSGNVPSHMACGGKDKMPKMNLRVPHIRVGMKTTPGVRLLRILHCREIYSDKIKKIFLL